MTVPAWSGASEAQLDAESAARAAADALLVPLSQKGAAQGVATLGGDGKVPAAQSQVSSVNGSTGAVVVPSADPLASPLRAWRAALANREYAQARALHIGDSTTEGGTLTALSQRWQERLAVKMRADFPAVGQVGGAPTTYLPAAWGTGNSLPAPGTVGGAPILHANGLGRRGYRLRQAGESVTFTVTGRFVDIAYTRQNTLGTATVTVDGVPAAALNTATGASGSFVSALKRYDLVTAAQHTVAIAYSSGSDVYLEGIVIYNGDDAKGVLHFDAGHFGYTTANFASVPTNAWMTTTAWLAPHLMTVNLGINDYKQNVGVATYSANVTQIISSLRANHPTPTLMSVLLLKMPQPTHPGTPTDAWSAFVAADAAIAAADTGGIGGASQIGLLDLSSKVPSPVTDNTLGLWNVDLTHPNAKGNAWLADVLAYALGPTRP